MKKLWNLLIRGFLLLKRPRNIVIVIIGLIFLTVVVLNFTGKRKSPYLTTVAEISSIKQEITATGHIKPSSSVDLSFERSGKLTYINKGIGEKVAVGQVIARLDNSELAAQYAREQANIMTMQTKLDQIALGSKAEDLNIARINLANAQKTLATIQSKQTADVATNAINTAINAAVSISAIQKINDVNPTELYYINQQKENLLFAIYGQSGLGTVEPWYFLPLDGRFKKTVSDLENNSGIVVASGQLLDAVRNVLLLAKTALDTTYSALLGLSGHDLDKTNINAVQSGMLSQIAIVSNQIQSLINAESAVNNAQAQLDLKISDTGYNEKIASAQLAQAQASLSLVAAQMEKNIVRSPIAGILGNVNPQTGELITAGQNIATVIGNSKYEIEANIPEADIAKVKAGNIANVTLDTFGQDVIWQAVVTQIYPAEKIIEGVATYKTVFNFLKNDDRIRSGLTANLDILNEKKDNVLTAPQRALIRKDGKKYMKILVSNDKKSSERYANLSVVSTDKNVTVFEVPVETGLVGSDGKVEIISGVMVGDKIVTN